MIVSAYVKVCSYMIVNNLYDTKGLYDSECLYVNK